MRRIKWWSLLGLILGSFPVVCAAEIILDLTASSFFDTGHYGEPTLPAGVLTSVGMIGSDTQTTSFGDGAGSISIDSRPSGATLMFSASAGSNLVRGFSTGSASFS